MTNNEQASQKPPITPDMKVGEFLKYYPELEEVLIGIAPVFAKLKNPVLRRTIAKVASLNQAAAVGDVSIGEMINRLRQAAGVEAMIDFGCGGEPGSGKPLWLDESQISYRMDARPMIDRGEHPLGVVVKELNRMAPTEIFELVTPFNPAPLIDKAKALGYEAWSQKAEANLVKTYFCKPKVK